MYLAPALLLMYGDVERTGLPPSANDDCSPPEGFYEKLVNRRSIMVVLRHLWTLAPHRPAFR
jgi:hypothetical protein